MASPCFSNIMACHFHCVFAGIHVSGHYGTSGGVVALGYTQAALHLSVQTEAGNLRLWVIWIPVGRKL